MSGYSREYLKDLADKESVAVRARRVAELADLLATVRGVGGRYEIYQTGTRYFVIEIGEGASEYVNDLTEFGEYLDALDNVVERVRRDDQVNRAAE